MVKVNLENSNTKCFKISFQHFVIIKETAHYHTFLLSLKLYYCILEYSFNTELYKINLNNLKFFLSYFCSLLLTIFSLKLSKRLISYVFHINTSILQ